MTNAKDKSPEEEGNEIESPVDGPTPDWMRLATSAGSGPSLTEENMPAWLKSIKAGKGYTQDPQTAPNQPAPEPPAAESSGHEAMSDLERLLAEEGIDLNSVTEERPEGSENMSARDWLIATSSEEIIRNKKLEEPQPTPEEPALPPVPIIAQTPSSPPPPESSSDDTMSDLERLLAAEGIDLGAVAEERPEGSENMSARDWLIATSSEEIIRNKLEAKPIPTAPTPPPVPHPAPSRDDDKMVVQEDLPDWLRDIAEETGEPAPGLTFDTLGVTPEEDQFVINDELPEWLQEIAEESAAPTPSTADTSLFSEDQMVGEDELPDWLREIADESPQTPGAEPSPPDLTEPPPLPVLKRPGTGPLSQDKMVIEEDLPDWLREIEAEAPPTPEREPAPAPPVAEVSSPIPEPDKMIVEEDLPDWLQEIATEAPAEAEAEPAWSDTVASPLPSSFGEDEMVVEEDLPEWLRKAAVEEAEVSAELPPPAPLDADKTIAVEDLPEWLRELESGAVVSGSGLDETDLMFASSDLDMIEGDENLPDWLREVEISGAVEDVLKPAFEAPPSGLEPVALTAEEMPGFEAEEEELPDWLKEVQEREGEAEPFEAVIESISTPPEPLSSTSELIIEEELPDWLKEVQEETEPFALEERPVAAELKPEEDMGLEEEELPEWLQEVQLDIEEPFEPSEPSPEPFAEVEAEGLVSEELPDWLQEAPAELPVMSEEEMPSLALAEPSVSGEVELVDETALPDWLRSVEEEVEPIVISPPVGEVITTAEEIGEEVAVEETVPVEEIVPAEEIVIEEIVEEIPVTIPPAPVIEMPVVAAPTGIPDWLQKLREVQVEEEPVPVLATPAALPVAAGRVTVAPEPVLVPAAPPPEPEFPPDAEERLRQARSARDKSDFDGASRLYNSLISSGAFLDKIIEDMQQAIRSHPGHYLLYQVMGDAMMRDGRLQSALKAYREALIKLQ